ncbi:hypothetical protein M514_13703 [Trichuris suis]|uniref:Uncharacterized protein n=1 Tax=Trichuris suis TaxID=68888 RepID=A0A085LKC2_9BILA|nr:hypothetical protein M513_13703 [Trichuris suis]KFD72850.1 hypothetical protein M514_13703 [Trichuris suis]
MRLRRQQHMDSFRSLSVCIESRTRLALSGALKSVPAELCSAFLAYRPFTCFLALGCLFLRAQSSQHDRNPPLIRRRRIAPSRLVKKAFPCLIPASQCDAVQGRNVLRSTRFARPAQPIPTRRHCGNGAGHYHRRRALHARNVLGQLAPVYNS